VRFLADNKTKRQPTPEEQATIDAVLAAHDPQGLTEAEELREAIKDLAQSAVGELLVDLTAAQIKALLACLLWKAGGVEDTMQVAPLGDWLK
jgi:hypothetical protein